MGGGIRDPQTARRAVQAGADWVVTGNLGEQFEDADELRQVLEAMIEAMISN